MRAEVSGLDEALSLGDTRPATDWLKTNIQVHGKRYLPGDLIEQATGAPASEGPLLDYLEAKFDGIYDL